MDFFPSNMTFDFTTLTQLSFFKGDLAKTLSRKKQPTSIRQFICIKICITTDVQAKGHTFCELLAQPG